MASISLKEFFERDRAYIHCTSAAQATQLLNAFHNMGQRWRGGQSYANETYWYEDTEEKWYSSDNGYASCEPEEGWDGTEPEVFEFNEITDFQVCQPIIEEKKQMRIFDRDTFTWLDAKFDPTTGYITVRGNEKRIADIIAIENDSRVKYVRCTKCGAYVRNTKKYLAEHAARGSNSKACLSCPRMRLANIQQSHTSFVKNEDGTYSKTEKAKCDLICGQTRNNYKIDSTEARGVCMYRQCSADTLKPIDDVFLKYPGLFDDMATVDDLGEKNWKFGYNYGKYSKFVYTGRYNLEVYVAKVGIINYFSWDYRNSTYNIMYSSKYDKLFLFDYDRYREISKTGYCPFSGVAYDNIMKIMHEIYKGEENA